MSGIEIMQAELTDARQENDWPRMVAATQQLVELVGRDEAADVDAAVERYNGVLDELFSTHELVTAERLAVAMAPFHAIDRLLRARGESRTLERQHRKMLYRLKNGPHRELQGTLCDALADLYVALGSERSAEASRAEGRRIRTSSD